MRRYLISISAIIFLATILYLPLAVPNKFNTPDENANFFFAKTFSETGSLKIFEPLNLQLGNAVHPRGVNIIAGYLVPESFLGLPIFYGWLGKISSTQILPYLPAIIAFLFLPFYYFLFKEIFNQKIACLSFFFLLINPVFWYNASRGFYHNLLFLNFFIAASVLALQAGKSQALKSWLLFSLAGLFLGMALFVRPAEALWVFVLFLGFFIYALFRRRFSVFGLGAALLPLVLMFFYNYQFYGSWFNFGYAVTESDFTSVGQAVPQLAHLTIFQRLFFPFGLSLLASLRRFAAYAASPLWWYALLIFLGFIFSGVVLIKSFKNRVSNSETKKEAIYLLVWAAISFYLILYYGSFSAEFFTDPGQEVQYKIGSAYLRYWLPIFVLAAPLAAQGWLFLTRQLNFFSAKKIVLPGFLVVCVFLSIRAVFWQAPEALKPIQDNLEVFSETIFRVQEKTPGNSVFLIPRWADRVYFPERRVVVDVEGKSVVKIIKGLLADEREVFYLAGRGAISLKADELAENKLNLSRRFDLDAKGKLYEISNF